MDWAELAKSLAVLLVGAGISIGTSVVLDRLRFKRDQALAATEQEKALTEARRAEGAAHTAVIYQHLNTMWLHSKGIMLGQTRPPLPPEAVAAEEELWSSYQLLPDPMVRKAVHDGLYALGNLVNLQDFPWKLKELGEDGYRQTVADMRDVVAAFIRRDDPPREQVERLADVAAHLDAQDPFV